MIFTINEFIKTVDLYYSSASNPSHFSLKNIPNAIELESFFNYKNSSFSDPILYMLLIFLPIYLLNYALSAIYMLLIQPCIILWPFSLHSSFSSHCYSCTFANASNSSSCEHDESLQRASSTLGKQSLAKVSFNLATLFLISFSIYSADFSDRGTIFSSGFPI